MVQGRVCLKTPETFYDYVLLYLNKHRIAAMSVWLAIKILFVTLRFIVACWYMKLISSLDDADKLQSTKRKV